MAKAIKAENISKAYQIGEFSTGTISRDLHRWWALTRGREDPYQRIGETNDRSSKGRSNIVWSLKDINFEVAEGDAVGIIGRNGAGKSTLLKILSKVTAPTTGGIKLKGRIASLLEVGTGFHPELTGRENIYLNGAILGMRKKEITRKFDEIVDFSGVERYIDTPVKRYSSGMYVRLAFGVAAHLESEILIVDEVLAVGDAEFQKKCLGKMNDVSKGEGRTVLFVSHQMDAITRLCERAIVLNQGNIEFDGKAEKAINVYYNKQNRSTAIVKWAENENPPGDKFVKLLEVATIDADGNISNTFDIRNPVGIRMKYKVLADGTTFTHGLNLYNAEGIHVLSSHDIETGRNKTEFNKGIYRFTAWIPGNFLAEGQIGVAVAIMRYDPFIIHFHEKDVLSFNIIDTIDGDSARGVYGGAFPGVVRPILKWSSGLSVKQEQNNGLI